mmetsp:Transcript_28471/g.54306  ORF Transcript_28471/g.54306 Transcript_28471/m.54306 type:complete len:215 (-) Transcript_28471:972-1616(-)
MLRHACFIMPYSSAITASNWPSDTPSRYMTIRSGTLPLVRRRNSSSNSSIMSCKFLMISTLLSPGCTRMRVAYWVADLFMDPTSAEMLRAFSLFTTECVTSAPTSMKGAWSKSRAIQPKPWPGNWVLGCISELLTTEFTPPSLAFTFRATLAQYCCRPRLGRKPMPAFCATKHCEGTPSSTSLDILTSLYPSPFTLSTTMMSCGGWPCLRSTSL